MARNVMNRNEDNGFRDSRRAFGIVEVAELIGVSPAFIRLEIQRKRLPTLRVGRRVLISRDAFDQYLADAARVG